MREEKSSVDNVTLQHWPKQLRVLDDLLKCGICYEYMQNTVVTPCSHNFCSVCIRTSLTFRNECPVCQANLSDGGLHPNRIVDSIVEAYDPVRCLILNSSRHRQDELRDDEGWVEITHSSSSSSNPGTSKERNSPAPQPTIPATQPPPAPLSSKVPCPVCSVEIKEAFINSHLDSCLKRASTSSDSRRNTTGTTQNRKPLPKLVYSLLSEKDLRKRLKELSLSTKGDKKTLEKRHQRFTILYNAEGDSAKPRSNADLVREIEREEAAERNLPARPSGILRTDRNADEALNEQERRRYLHENSNQFQKLIERAKRAKGSPVADSEGDSSSSEVVILENVPRKEKIIEEATIDDDDEDPPGATSKDSLFSDGEDTAPSSPVVHHRKVTAKREREQDATDVESDATEPDPGLMNLADSYEYEEPEPVPVKKARTTFE